VTRLRTLASILLTAACLPDAAQSGVYQQFRAHNAEMSELQPAMVTPLVASDPRLIQYYRFAFARQDTPGGTEITNYGNARGGGIILARRFEFDLLPPPYLQHTNTTANGFGDTSFNGKLRIASGNAERGNFDIAASLAHCFATGSHTNGSRTDSFTPNVVADFTVRKWSLVSALGGTLPTGKIAAQGRTIAWNEAAQLHASRHVWFELEDNATFYFHGPHDGHMQNFVTPAAFCVLRRKQWEPAHTYAVFTTGMQIATSAQPTYNHNWISELRVLF
jgi:hypothetical protein